jgi:hypothetical protein
MIKEKEPIDKELTNMGFLLKYTSYRKSIEGIEIVIYSLTEYHIFRIHHYLIAFKTVEEMKMLLEDIIRLIKENNFKGIGMLEKEQLKITLDSKSN